mmetsp:Transcript_57990/g.164772  ORF Transcript_57990/g.164772 Transcript_57990/m.164772 type:complete len:286 (-) Transcript_57990:360-1217(-)
MFATSTKGLTRTNCTAPRRNPLFPRSRCHSKYAREASGPHSFLMSWKNPLPPFPWSLHTCAMILWPPLWLALAASPEVQCKPGLARPGDSLPLGASLISGGFQAGSSAAGAVEASTSAGAPISGMIPPAPAGPCTRKPARLNLRARAAAPGAAIAGPFLQRAAARALDKTGSQSPSATQTNGVQLRSRCLRRAALLLTTHQPSNSQRTPPVQARRSASCFAILSMTLGELPQPQEQASSQSAAAHAASHRALRSGREAGGGSSAASGEPPARSSLPSRPGGCGAR